MPINFEIFEVFERHVDFDAFARGEHILKENRFHVLRGGRGSGKSVFAAKVLVLEAYMAEQHVLCLREHLNSIADSSMALLWEEIENMGLEWFFTKTKAEIVGQNGSRFFFKGLKTNVNSIKSLARVTRVLCEESEAITDESWQILTPSIRTPGARFIIIYNPRSIMDATHQRFTVNPPSDCINTEANYIHNPYFPDALDGERRDMQLKDPDLYEHIWLGKAVGDSPLSVIPAKWLRACVDIHKKININPEGKKQLGFDVAGAGRDFNATALMTGNVLTDLREFKQSDPTSAAHDAFRIATDNDVEYFVYDSIGVGAGTSQTVSESNWNNTTSKGLGDNGIKVEGFNAAGAIESPSEVSKGGSKPASEEFTNLKAQRWFDLRYRAQQSWLASQDLPYDLEYVLSFDSESINADLLEKLIFECSTPQREYLGSKLKVEAKEKLAKRGIASHNLADALIMALWDFSSDALEDILTARRKRRRRG